MRELIDRLRGYRAENIFNPWGESDPLDVGPHVVDQRVRLLEKHFSNPNPRYLLIGEAPGYRGCHFSGVPFTSEAELLLRGQIKLRLTTRKLPWAEASTTIMWTTLRRWNIADKVVMWNAYPFHPFKPYQPTTNRAPTAAELKATTDDFLWQVLCMFPAAIRICVGKSAERALKTVAPWAPDCSCVRHPSMGGAQGFSDQLRDVIRAHG